MREQYELCCCLDNEDENIRGDEAGGIPEVRDGSGELSDVEDDLGAVDVALQVAKLAASRSWYIISIICSTDVETDETTNQLWRPGTPARWRMQRRRPECAVGPLYRMEERKEVVIREDARSIDARSMKMS